MNQHRTETSRQRERIIEYSFGEFMRKGIRQVRVDDIAAALRISKRTLYEMFEDKETLLIECLRNHNEKVKAAFHRLVENGAGPLEVYAYMFLSQRNELRNMNPVFLSDVKRYPKVRAYFESEVDYRNECGRKFAEACVEHGLFIKGINYPLVLEISNMMGRKIMEQELYKKYGIDALFETMSLVHVRGLCTEKGLRVLDEGLRNVGTISKTIEKTV